MTSAIKVLLLLSALACLCHAQQKVANNQCLCNTLRDKFDSGAIANIEMFPGTDFCSKVEIIITHKSGNRYCLNTESRAAQRILIKLKTRK